MPSHLDFIFWSIFDWFLLPTSTPRTFKIIVFFFRKNEVFSKNRLSKLRMIFDTILVPTWLHFASPNPPKSSKNRFQEASKFWSCFWSFFNGICLRFGSQVGAMLATFFEPRCPQDTPRCPQDGHLGAKRVQNRIFIDFWSILDGFWIDFWSIFHRFGDDFWWIFGLISEWILISF